MSSTLKEVIVKKVLLCGICFETYQDPKCFPCQHTFCDSCLRSLYQLKSGASWYTRLHCPVCRSSVVGRSYEDLVKSNFIMRSLLEIIESFPNHDLFFELYRVQQGLCLNMDEAVAISEKNQSHHLLTYIHELRTEIFDLHQQLKTAKDEMHSKDETLKEVMTMLETQKCMIEQLQERVAEQAQIISALHMVDEEKEKRFNETKLVVTEKTQHLHSLEAQRNEFNTNMGFVLEELQKKTREQWTSVGEVMKPMDEKKVLVNVESWSTRL